MNDRDLGIWDKSSMTPPPVNSNKILSPMTIQGHYFLIHGTIGPILMTWGWPGEVTTAHHRPGHRGPGVTWSPLVSAAIIPSRLPLKQDTEHVLWRSSQSHCTVLYCKLVSLCHLPKSTKICLGLGGTFLVKVELRIDFECWSHTTWCYVVICYLGQ